MRILERIVKDASIGNANELINDFGLERRLSQGELKLFRAQYAYRHCMRDPQVMEMTSFDPPEDVREYVGPPGCRSLAKGYFKVVTTSTENAMEDLRQDMQERSAEFSAFRRFHERTADELDKLADNLALTMHDARISETEKQFTARILVEAYL